MFTPLNKLAEPPPPKGVSVKEWDKILEKGPTKLAAPVSLIRKAASALDFAWLTSSPPLETEDAILSMKLAAVEDMGLLETVFPLSMDLSQAIQDYEQMGGTYKHAFGAPMFDSRQLSGSPAVASGMKMRSAAQMEQMPQTPQGGQQAPRSPTPGTQRSGGASAPSAPSSNSAPAPAAPAAPAVSVSLG